MMETEAIEPEVTVGKLVQDFKVVMHDAESLLKASAGELGERAREARARLAASLETAKAQVVKVEEKAVASAIAGAKATDRVIREHPYQSVGVAFGVGLLIGVLVARR